MANKKILIYLKEGIKRGHPISSLRKALIKQGFKVADVNKAVKELGRKSESRGIVKSVLILGIVFVLLFGVYQFFYKIPTPEIAQWDCFAIATGKIDYCEEMVRVGYEFQEGALDNCYDEVYIRKAILESNPSICEKVTDEGSKIICEAITKNDITICANIQQLLDKVVCEAVLNKDISSCNTVEGTSSSQSFGAPQEDAKVSCQSDVYSWLAVITQDISYCKKISSLQPQSIYHRPYIHCRGAATGNVQYCSGRGLGNFFAKTEEDNAKFLRKQLGFLDYKPS